MRVKKDVLIVEDDDSLRESLEMYLQERGLTVYTAADGENGLKLWRRHSPQVIILDIKLPDASGLELLPVITEADPEVKVVMITAFHDMETTIEAMRLGAYDYIRKPLKADELAEVLDQALHIAAMARSHSQVVDTSQGVDPRHRIIGDTPEMNELFKTVGLLSRNQATVLSNGETGSGKELVARVIHDVSQFKDEPFITIDCSTLVESLLETELFGHERGAFTGAVQTKKGRLELAGRGTIFFDEIGDLPSPLQSKLLRFIEYREFTRVGGTQPLISEARIIAATNKNLDAMAEEGSFRPDLLFRLKVVRIELPPLRHRLDDLPKLVQFFLWQINNELHISVTRVEDAAMAALREYSWPGNVRELKNVLIKAALDSRGSILLGSAVQNALSEISADLTSARDLVSLEELEKDHIRAVLKHTNWNVTEAAKALGVSRPTLRKRMGRYGFKKPGA